MDNTRAVSYGFYNGGYPAWTYSGTASSYKHTHTVFGSYWWQPPSTSSTSGCGGRDDKPAGKYAYLKLWCDISPGNSGSALWTSSGSSYYITGLIEVGTTAGLGKRDRG